MTDPQILTNAKLVLPDEVVTGTLAIVEGKIGAIDQGRSNLPAAIDCAGDYILPGLVELHTDNLEKHFSPRPRVSWPGVPAALAHDAQLAAAGITTVFDAVCLGDLFPNSTRVRQLEKMSEAIAHTQMLNVFRAEHHIHLRCELSFDGVVELFDEHVDDPLVGLISLMDHTPGQRQFADLSTYREYYQKKYGLNDIEIEDFARKQRLAHDQFSDRHRGEVVAKSHSRRLPIASHDDATAAHIEEALALGAVIAEFPTTIEAARAAHQGGLKVLMGAPNLVLGGSHSGNISALILAQESLLDIISSDYVPSSLLQGVFILAGEDVDHGLPDAIRKAAANPAQAADLTDRGEIAVHKRADLLRVARCDDVPFVVTSWREGRRMI
ncbi:MAG: alpha-D-ribose 1-methylphosphonate 5-triphosphate diphosphatase [Rhodospirillaceae bacterium]|nr:alpha-D-ribose 1-methylphosphonate 5-triphosphate diphosphatase [Rhodospirillaceae bacterium]